MDAKKANLELIHKMLINSTEFSLNHIEVIKTDENISIYSNSDTLSFFEVMAGISAIFGGRIGMYVDYDHEREKCYYRVY